ncbi:hypothetical protein RCH13_001808 [Chryseobacterium sp. MP_3.2]|nr:hypothetical protein [Chryseobacterium sp. MP_3.2]
MLKNRFFERLHKINYVNFCYLEEEFNNKINTLLYISQNLRKLYAIMQSIGCL